MARISTYVVDGSIVDDDKVIGSDANNSMITKNYTIRDLAAYIGYSIGNNSFVPYNNANADVDLDTFNLTATSLILRNQFILNGTAGLPGQVIISDGSGSPATWGYNIGTQTLRDVLNQGNIGNKNLILSNNIASSITLDLDRFYNTSIGIRLFDSTLNNTSTLFSNKLDVQDSSLQKTASYSASGITYSRNGSTVNINPTNYSNQTLSYPSNSGVLVTSVNNVTADSTGNVTVDAGGGATTSDITADLEVGGIAEQQVVPAGTTLQEFAQLLLTTTFNPSITGPSFSLSNNAGIKEVGTIVSFTLTFAFNRGAIIGKLVAGVWVPTTFQDFRAGESVSYTINGTTQAGNALSVPSYTVLNGSNTFTGNVTYAEGPQPTDSKGDDYLAPLPADTSPLQSTSFSGIYPYYWYKSSTQITEASMKAAIENGTATKVVGISTGTITINFGATGQYLAFAYPASSNTKTIWFVNAFDFGTIPGGVFGGPTELLVSASTSSPIWENVNYKIHVTAGLITQTGDMQLRNS